MKLYQKLAAGVLSLAMMYQTGCGLSERAKEDEAKFRREESAIVKMIENESPFSQTPVEAPYKKEESKKWYENEEHYPFIINQKGDVIYTKAEGPFSPNSLYLASKGEEKNSREIAKDVSILKNYLYSTNFRDKENPDIYWFTDSPFLKNVKLMYLKNEEGTFVQKGPLLSAGDYFSRGGDADYLDLGDINGDGRLDLVYNDFIKVGNRKMNVISALIGKEDGGFDKKILYYLGEKKLEGLIARDVDNDGDSDLIFKLEGDDNHLFGLENQTKKNNSPLVFQDGFREKIESGNNTVNIAAITVLFNTIRIMNTVYMTTHIGR